MVPFAWAWKRRPGYGWMDCCWYWGRGHGKDPPLGRDVREMRSNGPVSQRGRAGARVKPATAGEEGRAGMDVPGRGRSSGGLRCRFTHITAGAQEPVERPDREHEPEEEAGCPGVNSPQKACFSRFRGHSCEDAAYHVRISEYAGNHLNIAVRWRKKGGWRDRLPSPFASGMPRAEETVPAPSLPATAACVSFGDRSKMGAPYPCTRLSGTSFRFSLLIGQPA